MQVFLKLHETEKSQGADTAAACRVLLQYLLKLLKTYPSGCAVSQVHQ